MPRLTALVPCFGGPSVDHGKPKDKQVLLKAGDKIACSLDKLCELKLDLV